MAYEKARELLDLALALAGSHYGLSATEIENRLADNGKTTASGKALERQRQRMLTQIEVLFGASLEVTTDEENRRRWTLRTRDLANMPLVDPANMAVLDLRRCDPTAERFAFPSSSTPASIAAESIA